MSKMMIDKSAKLEYKNHENVEFNNSFDRAKKQAIILPAEILTQSMVFLQHGLTMISLMAFLFTMHWIMTAIIIASAVPVALVKIYFSKEKWDLYYRNTLLRRESNYLNRLLTMPIAAKRTARFWFQ